MHKLRLKTQLFTKTIYINKDINELTGVDIFDVLHKSLNKNILTIDSKRRYNQLNDNGLLKDEYIKLMKYTESKDSKPIFTITKDNKICLNINILVKHYSKIIDIDWLKYIDNLSKHSNIAIYYYVLI